MQQFRIISSNIDSLKDRNLQAKEAEISIAVLEKDIENLIEKPVFYASRFGMLYNPDDDFRPNVAPNHKIKGLHVEEYYNQLPNARKLYSKILEKAREQKQGGGNSAELAGLKAQIEQKQARIDEQARQIEELLKKSKDVKNQDQIARLENMINTLSAVQSNRIEIVMKGKTNVIEKVLHEKFETIIQLTTRDQAAYLYGPAGTGKSQLAEDIAKALELDFYPASTLTQEYKLTGFIDAGGNYHETNFYKAMKYGGLFFLDEMDSSSSDVLVGINGALANGYFDFPIGTVDAHENFRVIGAGNTIGRGADMQYTGRQVLDLSTLDRFWGVEIEYSQKIDAAIANNDMELIEFAKAFRQAAKENDIYILLSYRSLGRIANFQDVFSLKEIMEMAVIKGVAADDVRMLVRNMNIPSTNKYYKALKQAA